MSANGTTGAADRILVEAGKQFASVQEKIATLNAAATRSDLSSSDRDDIRNTLISLRALQDTSTI